MQIKKQEIEDALIRTAEEDFYKYGFSNASVRRILTKTGVSIGNFYNYFQNKEALYEKVVGSEYRRFLSMMTEHEHHEHNGSYEGRLSDVIARVIPDFSRRFVILIEGSEVRGLMKREKGWHDWQKSI
jgi:AcrR family transcriptional regulator